MNNPSNYRGISPCDTSSKLYSTIINNKLREWVKQNNITGEYEAGFKRRYSTIALARLLGVTICTLPLSSVTPTPEVTQPVSSYAAHRPIDRLVWYVLGPVCPDSYCLHRRRYNILLYLTCSYPGMTYLLTPVARHL